jgi:hypothetical protein
MFNPSPEKEISIYEVEELIKNNPNKDEILRLHELPVKSDEYNQLKAGLPCITPHATFKGYKKDSYVKSCSNYMYYDIDLYNTTHSVEAYDEYILSKHADKISHMGRSVGNRGYFIYVRIDDSIQLNKENFNVVYNYIKKDVLNDIPIDPDAKGISRYQIIPYDPNLYINHSASINIPVHVYTNYTGSDSSNKGSTNSKGITEKSDFQLNYINNKSFRGNVTFIPLDELLKKYHFKTPVEVIDPLYEIKPVPYVECYVPKIIKDGKKHSTYRIMTNVLVHLNPGIDLFSIQSYIYWINQNYTDNKPMREKELLSIVKHAYYKSLETGLWFQPRIKMVHFNPKAKLTGEEKMLIAARENGNLRKQRSIDTIKTTIQMIRDAGEKLTKKKVKKYANLTYRTILRRWDEAIAQLESEGFFI